MKKMLYVVLIMSLVIGIMAVDSLDLFTKKVDAVETNGDENIVTVSGKGSVKVKPDIAYINIGVDIFNKDANVAQTENSNIMNKVIESIKNLGISEDDIKTISYNVYKNTKYQPTLGGKDEEIIEGYTVRNIVEVTVKDLEKVGEVIDESSKAGANSIGNIRFGVVDEAKYYNEALKISMENAESKAQSILETFGASVSKPYSIVETSGSAPVFYYQDRADFAIEAKGMSTPITTSELEITASVSVKYKY